MKEDKQGHKREKRLHNFINSMRKRRDFLLFSFQMAIRGIPKQGLRGCLDRQCFKASPQPVERLALDRGFSACLHSLLPIKMNPVYFGVVGVFFAKCFTPL